MKNKFYIPILKSKNGEFDALSKLRVDVKDFMCPLFEVTPVEWDNVEREKPKSLQDHLEKFAIRFAKKWTKNCCFVDTALLNWAGIDNTSKIETIFDLLASKDFVPHPVIWPNSTLSFKAAFNRIISKFGISEVGIRVTLDDVSSPDFLTDLENLLGDISFSPDQCHLILDLKDSKFNEVENIADMVLMQLEDFPFFSQWKSFSVVGTAFPSSKNIKEGLSTFDRNEWNFYKALKSKLNTQPFRRNVNYGDYSIVSPEYFEFNPKLMKASANIRYTHDEKYLVSKGKKLANKESYKQYKGLAEKIFYTDFYLGEIFSEGDRHLAKCVRGETKTQGAPSTWNWVGNNHHFTKVIQDLTAIGFFS